MKHSGVEAKLGQDCPREIHSNIKDQVTSELSLPDRTSSTISGLQVSNLSLNLNLTDDIDKSPVSPFITDVHEHPLDHESTINLQDLR